MSEHFPDEQPDWERREASVQRAREAIGAGETFDTITVAYDSPAYDSGQVWIRATCSGCPAELVTRASHPVHLMLLASDLGYSQCPRFGHEHQDAVKEAERRFIANHDLGYEDEGDV